MALKAAQKMCVVLDKPKELNWYQTRIERIENNFEKVYWQGNRYGSKNKPIEERTSALAIASGLAKKEHHKILVDSVLMPVQKSSPHMEWMVEEAIMLTGQYEKGLARMKKRYAEQVNNKDLTTLYEKFLPKLRGTYNHAWNAPNYVLSRYISGVKATRPAWEMYEVKPNLAGLTSVSQIVPSVKGDITVNVKKSEKHYQIDLASPPNTTAMVYIPKAGKEVSKVMVNGRIIWKKVKRGRRLKAFYLAGEELTPRFQSY